MPLLLRGARASRSWVWRTHQQRNPWYGFGRLRTGAFTRTSNLETQDFEFGDAVARVAVAWPRDGAAIDAAWAPHRKTQQSHHHWSWALILKQARDGWKVVVGPQTVAVFATHAPGLCQLGGCQAYRLDYLEVRPDLLATAVGTFAMALVAERALECGAECVVLEAFPQVLGFYEKLGARSGPIEGLLPDPELIPLIFDRAALLYLSAQLP